MTFLVLPRFNMMTLVTMIETMRTANEVASRAIYAWEIVSFEGRRVQASNGLSLPAGMPSDRIHRGETILLMGSWGAEAYRARDTLAWLRRQARGGARICAVEIGAYVAARAGLLDGRQATTHWSYGPGFAERFAGTTFVEQLYTPGPQVVTCAGGLAGVDLVLWMIGGSHGTALAEDVAERMLYHAPRPATAPQRRMTGQGGGALPPVVRDAIAMIERSLTEPPRVPEIARRLGVSQRQLERRFKESVGCSVVQFGLLLRLQHARVLLISTDLGVREVAAASGFNTLSHFIVSFRRSFGRRPSDYRSAWPEKDATPSWPGTLTEFLHSLQIRPQAKARR